MMQISIREQTAEQLSKYAERHGLRGAMWDVVIVKLLKEPDTEEFIKLLNKEFEEHINIHCNDIGSCSHDNAQDVLDCFLRWLEEQLPEELHYDEETECWGLMTLQGQTSLTENDETAKETSKAVFLNVDCAKCGKPLKVFHTSEPPYLCELCG